MHILAIMAAVIHQMKGENELAEYFLPYLHHYLISIILSPNHVLNQCRKHVQIKDAIHNYLANSSLKVIIHCDYVHFV